MLERIVKEGFTSQEIKQAIRETLSPYFNNKDILNKHLLDSQFVSIFGYLMVYQKDDVFINELKNIINIYKGALETNSVKAIKNCPKLTGNFCPRHDAICVQLRPWGQPQTPEFFAVIFPERVI